MSGSGAGEPQFQAERHERSGRRAFARTPASRWSSISGRPGAVRAGSRCRNWSRSTEQYKDKGLTIVGISIDDSPEQIRAFAKEYSVHYPLLVGAGRDDVLAAFGYFGAVPMSIFINADGRITASVPGVATTATWERRIQELF